MRIAFSGAHRVGKTTLVETLAARLRGYRAFDEPYRVLEEDGYEFSDPPTVEDFERQLRQSIEMIESAPANALFDRCPLDFLAYAEELDADVSVMEALDLVVFVPIEVPDRVIVGVHEDRRLRATVDERLRSLVLDDARGLGIEAIEVTGTVEARVQQILAALPIR